MSKQIDFESEIQRNIDNMTMVVSSSVVAGNDPIFKHIGIFNRPTGEELQQFANDYLEKNRSDLNNLSKNMFISIDETAAEMNIFFIPVSNVDRITIKSIVSDDQDS